MAIHSNSIPQPRGSVEAREVGGELLLYRDKDLPGVTLNPTARRIWELCDGRRDLLAIAGELGRRFECPGEALLPDVEGTLEQLADMEMLSVLAPTGTPRRGSKSEIDWSRLAAPQADLYDIERALDLLGARTSSADWPHCRPSSGESVKIADGKVTVRHCYRKTRKNLVDAPTDHANISLAMEYLRRWPLGYEQFKATMHTLHPLVDPAQDLDDKILLRSSYSHSAEGMWGTMWSTINCPVMLAENSIHEMAHQKLFALGVYKESCLALVTNAPGDRYVSPVITDRLRPMTAVLHGVYAFTYVVQLDIHLVETEQNEEARARMERRLAGNVRKLENGLPEVRAHIRIDEEGGLFMEGLYDWLEGLIRRGNELGRSS